LTLLGKSVKIRGLSTTQNTLVLSVREIPVEGKAIDVALDPGAVHLEGEEEFTLEGGRLTGQDREGRGPGRPFPGRLQARLGLHCGRCLEPFVKELDEELDLFFMPRGEEADAKRRSRRSSSPTGHGRRLLTKTTASTSGEMVREQMHLALPLRRLCREDCRGLCPSCG
jgi:uncharacterized protein